MAINKDLLLPYKVDHPLLQSSQKPWESNLQEHIPAAFVLFGYFIGPEHILVLLNGQGNTSKDLCEEIEVGTWI